MRFRTSDVNNTWNISSVKYCGTRSEASNAYHINVATRRQLHVDVDAEVADGSRQLNVETAQMHRSGRKQVSRRASEELILVGVKLMSVRSHPTGDSAVDVAG
jgi:hypothetical protein